MLKSKAKMKMNRNKRAAAKGNDPSASQERQEREDPFKKLADDLIISHIFGKIPEAKSLFMCSSVSKHFASLVLRTHKLSFVFPFWISPYIVLLNLPNPIVLFTLPPRFQLLKSNPREFLKQFRRPTTRPKPSVSSPDKLFSSMYFGFLQKLSFVEDLNIDVSSTRNYEGLDFSFIWVLDYKSSSAFSFLVLLFKNLIPANTTEIDDAVESTEYSEDGNRFDGPVFPSLMRYLSSDALFRLKLLKSMLEGFPNLKSAVISDSFKQGKLIVREEALAEMRTQDAKMEARFCLKWWFRPLIKLPISGFVMEEGAVLGIMKVEGTGEYEDIAKDSFEGEEVKAFLEAAMKLLETEEVYEDGVEIRFVNGAMRLQFRSEIMDS